MIRFLLGVLVGVAAAVYFFHTGGGDYFISSSTKVRNLEAQLQAADQKQDQLAKKLEEATAVIEKMTSQFTSLEQRFQALQHPPSMTPPAEKPPTEEKPSTSASPPDPTSASPPHDAQGTAKEAPSSTSSRSSSLSDPS